jgi:hypothetical protein
MLIPLRLADAPLPAEIDDRRYADFSASYSIGFDVLVKELRSIGADGASAPLSKVALPLHVRRGTYLLQPQLGELFDYLRTRSRPGEEVTAEQFRFPPDDEYLQARAKLLQSLDSGVHPDKEEFCYEVDRRLRKLEQVLLLGLAQIVNNVVLGPSPLHAVTCCHWWFKLIRTNMFWLASAADAYVRGEGLEPNIYWRPAMDLEEVYGTQGVDRVDIGPRHPNDWAMYTGFTVRLDPEFRLRAEVESWREKYHAQNQEPVSRYLSWADVSKWVVPQLLCLILLDEKNLPMTWDFDYWMIGEP